MASVLKQRLNQQINTHGDINEHLSFLYKLSCECDSILECGVRTVVSTWAFINGLLDNNSTVKQLVCCDLQKSPSINEVETVCKQNSIDFSFITGNDINISMQDFSMIFIDTWHIYGHLKRELDKMHSYAKKYIVMHDTEVDKIHGESLRCGWDTAKQSLESGYPEEEIRCGLGRAVDEFLTEHPEWKIKVHFTHNNGLTVLERV
jgi:cephalosporin hydroxylase